MALLRANRISENAPIRTAVWRERCVYGSGLAVFAARIMPDREKAKIQKQPFIVSGHLKPRVETVIVMVG
jgi:hypothetical protein